MLVAADPDPGHHAGRGCRSGGRRPAALRERCVRPDQPGVRVCVVRLQLCTDLCILPRPGPFGGDHRGRRCQRGAVLRRHLLRPTTSSRHLFLRPEPPRHRRRLPVRAKSGAAADVQVRGGVAHLRRDVRAADAAHRHRWQGRRRSRRRHSARILSTVCSSGSGLASVSKRGRRCCTRSKIRTAGEQTRVVHQITSSTNTDHSMATLYDRLAARRRHRQGSDGSRASGPGRAPS